MNKSETAICLLAILLLVLAACQTTGLGSGGKGDYRISVGQLKEMLGDPNLIIIDVRDPVSWATSDIKILGAVREDPQNVDVWADKYAKDKTIVLYCA